MYLLYLDESGSHAGSPVLVLAGIAVHEQDTWRLQSRLDSMLQRKLPQGLDPQDFELHATEIKSPNRPRRVSRWAKIPEGVRAGILRATFGILADHLPTNPQYPCALFGAVVDRSYADQEQRAYEEVLHKFDEMLNRHSRRTGIHERGIVIHDRRIVERDVQRWAALWRRVAGRIGTLMHLADVPLFADSQASRLIQAADFVSWALYRSYGDSRDSSWIKSLWGRFDADGGIMHGLIHVSPGFANCACRPCSSRHAAGR
jgi:hypothetical protein